MNSKIKLVIFDLDGTLIDSLPDLANSANRVRQLYNLEKLPMEKIRNYIGDGMRTLIHRTLTDSRDGKNEELIEAALAEHAKYYAEHLTEQTKLFAGVEDVLSQLEKLNFKIALVTNKPKQNALKILKFFNIENYFSSVYGGDSLPKRKPNPDPILATLHDLGIDSSEAIMVGDSENDILAGKSAGLTTVFALYGYGKREYLPIPADKEINNIVEIFGVLPC